MLTGCPLVVTPFTALAGTTPGPTVGAPGPITVLPTRAESREISSREDTSADVSRSFSVDRYSTLACREASHAFFRCRHFSAARQVSKCYKLRCLDPKPCLLRSRKFLRFSSSVSGLFGCLVLAPPMCWWCGCDRKSSSSSSSSSSSPESRSLPVLELFTVLARVRFVWVVGGGAARGGGGGLPVS